MNEKMLKTLIILLASICLVQGLPPPHPAVVAVRHQEEHLHPHLRSPALRNPRLREVLPLTSLLHSGENPVFDREADHVSRQEIYNILTHAGFLQRRPKHYQPDPFHRPHDRKKSHHQHGTTQHHQHQVNPGFYDVPIDFHNPELLQYL